MGARRNLDRKRSPEEAKTWSALSRGRRCRTVVRPIPNEWRGFAKQPSTLRHYPVVLHRADRSGLRGAPEFGQLAAIGT
jgi:hypothetical protein